MLLLQRNMSRNTMQDKISVSAAYHFFMLWRTKRIFHTTTYKIFLDKKISSTIIVAKCIKITSSKAVQTRFFLIFSSPNNLDYMEHQIQYNLKYLKKIWVSSILCHFQCNEHICAAGVLSRIELSCPWISCVVNISEAWSHKLSLS
jgi:hypothetical protein